RTSYLVLRISYLVLLVYIARKSRMEQITTVAGSPPIFLIGAGGIVNTAHLPAYQMAGFDVQGIYDLEYDKAVETAKRFSIPMVFKTIEEMLDSLPAKAVFDIAVPGSAAIPVLKQLPSHSSVLMQKPMGENLKSAEEILEITRTKRINAGVNFQLRYAPFIKEARKMVEEGQIGELNDIEVNVNVHTPWYTWDFLLKSPRVEILYHSIHYIDLVRSFLGNPETVYAKTTKHPATKDMAPVRSNIIMDYGELIRANILTNHSHVFGRQHQQSYIKLEGSKGAIKISFGVLKNYPQGGEPDKFEYVITENGRFAEWKSKSIEGSWFPHAFIGSMEQVMLAAAGVIPKADNSVEDCIFTMACVEAAYRSSEQGGVRPGAL
ncbi:MAG: Gfo/Idh/MocA family oxidoreductase, partial [Chitinophagaceae bacterium]